MEDHDTDRYTSKGPERRKKARRSGKDRRAQMRWELDNPIRRKSPGRRTLDRLFNFMDPKR